MQNATPAETTSRKKSPTPKTLTFCVGAKGGLTVFNMLKTLFPQQLEAALNGESVATVAELAYIHQHAAVIARSLPDECRELICLADEGNALSMEIVEQPSGGRRIVVGFSVEGEDGAVEAGELCSFDCPEAVQPGLRLETFHLSLLRKCQAQ